MLVSHYRMNESNVSRRRGYGWLVFAGVLLACAVVVLTQFEGC